MSRRNNILVRASIVFAFMATVLFSLIYKMYELQVTRHKELYRKAKSKYTAVTSKNGLRGEIYDSNGHLLVGNIPCMNIVIDPQLVGEKKQCIKIARYFSKRLSIPFRKILRRLMTKTVTFKDKKSGEIVTKNLRYAVIEKQVDLQLANKIQDEIKEKKFKGIYFNETTKRYYPKNELLANILGFTNIDRDKVIAVVGLERFFNKKISPTAAKTRFERARDGTPLSYGFKQIEKVKDGLNVYLTIREPIQAILEEELDELVKKWQPKAAYAVMADPYTGNILAIAQRPTFNPNDRATMKPEAWRNRIIEDIFEPGSTMKPIAIGGAVDYGVVIPRTKIDCEHGYWFYAGKPLRDSHPMDIITVAEIIKQSSNIGTAKICLRMGDQRLYDTLRRYGFGQRTGIPLKPETRGILHPVRKWSKLSVTRLPIGQGIAVSPLQLVRAYCALANGGNLVKLRLVDRLENPDTGITIKMPIEKTKKTFLRETTHRKVIEMMKLVTQEGGTATRAAIEGYDVAGKTGTSQKVINGAYSHSKYFASFIGFVPADKPAFVLLVTADEPKKNHYGGVVSGPAFKNISKRTLRFLNVRPQYWVADADYMLE